MGGWVWVGGWLCACAYAYSTVAMPCDSIMGRSAGDTVARPTGLGCVCVWVWVGVLGVCVCVCVGVRVGVGAWVCWKGEE